MCGVGLIFSKTKSTEQRTSLATKMHMAIEHRGPDGFDVWNASEGLSLFHRRLAIVDLSEHGRQPMISPSKRWVISFNGEIYNYKALRQTLQNDGIAWRGTSDTEVLLNLIEKHGVTRAIQMADGMFAIILWDQIEKKIYLIRDRLGEKPLYYGFVNGDFVVGSELKVFHQHSDFKPEINQDALAAFLKYSYVPAPLSIFTGIFKAKAAHIYVFDPRTGQEPKKEKYWEVRPYTAGPTEGASRDYDTVKKKIHELLFGIVGREMQADVPLGCFLSGGVDSSLICALMTQHKAPRIDTFSIGFDDKNYDESVFAKPIAKHLGTHHTEYILSAKDSLGSIEKIPQIYDEPFADSSQIPTYLLAQVTRKHVTVALSGDGGDELFAGYNRYHWGRKIWSKISSLPYPVRAGLSFVGGRISHEGWDSFYNAFSTTLGGGKKVGHFGSKVHKGFEYLKARSLVDFHNRILGHWHEPQDLLVSRRDYNLPGAKNLKLSQFDEYMMWHDQHHYLPDDILVKVDRAAMANSLEVRAPFLDHSLLDYVLSIDKSIVRSTEHPKQILKDILYSYVPRKLLERPKHGFTTPLHSWLKNDLRELVEDVLAEKTLERQGLFDARAVTKFVRSQLDGDVNLPFHLWDLVAFQLWYKRWMEK